jgi:hypothetical protein
MNSSLHKEDYERCPIAWISPRKYGILDLPLLSIFQRFDDKMLGNIAIIGCNASIDTSLQSVVKFIGTVDDNDDRRQPS